MQHKYQKMEIFKRFACIVSILLMSTVSSHCKTNLNDTYSKVFSSSDNTSEETIDKLDPSTTLKMLQLLDIKYSEINQKTDELQTKHRDVKNLLSLTNSECELNFVNKINKLSEYHATHSLNIVPFLDKIRCELFADCFAYKLKYDLTRLKEDEKEQISLISKFVMLKSKPADSDNKQAFNLRSALVSGISSYMKHTAGPVEVKRIRNGDKDRFSKWYHLLVKTLCMKININLPTTYSLGPVIIHATRYANCVDKNAKDWLRGINICRVVLSDMSLEQEVYNDLIIDE